MIAKHHFLKQPEEPASRAWEEILQEAGMLEEIDQVPPFFISDRPINFGFVVWLQAAYDMMQDLENSSPVAARALVHPIYARIRSVFD